MLEAKFIILLAVVLVANVVEAVTGFGSTIIAVTIGANFYEIGFLLPVLVPANLVMSTYIVVRHRRHVNREVLFRTILPLVAVGTALGMVGFYVLNSNIMKIGFGVFVLLFSTYQVIRTVRTPEGVEQPPLSKAQAAAWLIAGGVMQGLYASGGPMVVFFASRVLRDKGSFRATLSSLWLTVNVLMTISYMVKGKMTAETLRATALVIPVIICGIIIGEILHKWIPERAFRIVVFALLVAAGAALLIGS